jgi:hypothetical protein
MVQFDRRAFLKIGSIAPFGSLSWGEALRERPKPNKELSIIHLLLAGGLSHIDTFDMKPGGNPKFRSPFKPIPTNVDGLEICEHLPLTAKQADKFTVIRSMTHKDPSHEGALSLMLTGHPRSATVQAPSIGSVVLKELGPRNELVPAYVSIPSARGGAPAGFLPRFNPPRFNPPRFNPPRFNPMASGDPNADNHDRTAPDRMRSPLASKAFDIAAEPEALREKYGRTRMGEGCLQARRLVESGVRLVTVRCGRWDHHTDIFNTLATDYLPELDRAYATLLEDLHRRGLLDSTIVLVSGEFGRTPEINAYTGRDHWPNCFSLLIAGGGIEGGRVWGSSDKDARFVRDNPVEVPDLLATLYRKLGIDHTQESVSNIGRPIRFTGGEPLAFL